MKCGDKIRGDRVKIEKAIKELTEKHSNELMNHIPKHGVPMPSLEELEKVMYLAKQVLFPGYFGQSALEPDTMPHYVGVNTDKLYRSLSQQIKCGLCFACTQEENFQCQDCENKAEQLAVEFISRLPQIQHLLTTDVQAIYEGDPAARSHGEVIFCYPSIKALTHHRVAHELLKLEVPLIPRIISELAHSQTGIDIHPRARIGEYFAMDHGTGIVIGATCIIGRHVKLYQGVTLGAKSFPLDEQGKPIKFVDRHPIVEDNVIIYAGATILGRITIGQGSVIGGNVWVTNNLPPGSKVNQQKARQLKYINGAGI